MVDTHREKVGVNNCQGELTRKKGKDACGEGEKNHKNSSFKLKRNGETRPATV
jgi:hypothetical protein